MTTGDPGTDAEVTNSGTPENAIFDFVIPRGEPGGGGAPEVLATVDTAPQQTAVNSPLVFTDNPLISGAAISHTAGSSSVQINLPGIYQVIFHGTISVNTGTPIPSSLQVSLNLDGVPVTGASARHSFSSTDEVATMSFDLPIRVTNTVANLEVIADQDGFTFEDVALTVIRLGDAS